METSNYLPKIESDLQTKSDEYNNKYQSAPRGRGYRNCAGFVRYLMGISQTDGFLHPDNSTHKGLISNLNQVDIMEPQNFDEREYLEKVKGCDVIGFLKGKNNQYTYVHFCVPDPINPLTIFQRPDFEADPEKIDIRTAIKKDTELTDSTQMIFLKKKQKN